MEYDGDRIKSKSDVGIYSFNTGNHQVKEIDPSFGGASAGSAYLPANHTIAYTAEGKVSSISESETGKQYAIEYGLGNQRFKSEYSESGTSKYTRYYSGHYEKEVRDGVERQLNYISANGELIAIYEQKPSEEKMHYIYSDYLGSLRCITDDHGNIEQRLGYDAWGNRRNAITGAKLSASEVTQASALTQRGYTGHEHIDEMGLINMNGRVYDPDLGMFLSPDPEVQAPDNSQSYNRYAYCMNNPLMYTDPSGYSWWSHFTNWVGNNWKPIAIAAVAIGVTVLTAGLAAPFAAGMGLEGAMGVAALSGMAGGAVSGAGNAWAQGGSFSDCFGAGFTGMVMGGIGGAAMAGAMGGIGSIPWLRGGGGPLFLNSHNSTALMNNWTLADQLGKSSLYNGVSKGMLASGLAGTLMGDLLAQAQSAGDIEAAAKGPNSIQYDTGVPLYKKPVMGGGPGSSFGSLNSAAMDFGIRYNDNSIRDNREFATAFYKYNKNGVTCYSYTTPVYGPLCNGPDGTVNIPYHRGQVGWGHTHGPLSEGSSTFSPADFNVKNRGGIAYLCNPSGALYRYNYSTGLVDCVVRGLPSYLDFNKYPSGESSGPDR
jgi:RHS repeat-associated protein